MHKQAQMTHLSVNLLWEQGHVVVKQFSFHQLSFTSPVSLQPVRKELTHQARIGIDLRRTTGSDDF